MKGEERGVTERQKERGAGEPGSGALRPDDGPNKQHGDALRDGSGSRHGMTDRGSEPEPKG